MYLGEGRVALALLLKRGEWLRVSRNGDVGKRRTQQVFDPGDQEVYQADEPMGVRKMRPCYVGGHDGYSWHFRLLP
jgi:hypothetical protein